MTSSGDKTLNPLPLSSFLGDILHKWPTNEWKIFSQDKRVVLKPPIEVIKRLWSTSKNLNFALRRLFIKNYKLEIQWPSHEQEKRRNYHIYSESFLKEGNLLEKNRPNGRIAFHSIKTGSTICFDFKHFPVLKQMGLIENQIYRLIINANLNDEQLEEIKHNFKEVDDLVIKHKVADKFTYELVKHFALSIQFLQCPLSIGRFEELPRMPELIKYIPEWESSVTENKRDNEGTILRHDNQVLLYSDEHDEIGQNVYQKMAAEYFDNTINRCHSFRFTSKNENFRLNPLITKFKVPFYLHRSIKHLESVLKDDLAYVEKHAPTLEEFEIELPDSDKYIWRSKTQVFNDYSTIYNFLKRFIPFFHQILNSVSKSPIRIRLSLINFTFFYEGWAQTMTVDGDDGITHTIPPTRIYFTSTHNNNGKLEMGLFGQKPLIEEEIPFDLFHSYGENQLKPLFENFFELLEKKYGLIVPE